MPNQLIWIDIPVHDMDRSIKFYSAVLGSAVRKQNTLGQSVGVLPQDFGAASGTLVQATGDLQPSPQGSQFYLNCSGRLKEAVAAVTANGGAVLQPVNDIGGHGFRAVVLDSEGNRLCLYSEIAIDQFVDSKERAIRDQPDYPLQLLDLANSVAQRDGLKAYELCRKAMSLGAEDPAVAHRARKLLARLIPGYHGPMVNDARRNAAWDQALKRAIRRGSRVLEIGTGTGMLAMMAARAGARRVTTCEYHPVVAALAREIVAKNGFQDRITVLSKSSLDLRLGVDLEKRADLLFCDNFSDGLFGFRPLQSIADARQRLLKPNAPALPAAASAQVALGDWGSYRRCYQLDESCGFDVSLLADCVSMDIDLEIGDRGVSLLSEDCTVFRFDFSGSSFPKRERAEIPLIASRDGMVTGLIQWIRLELDSETILEARPEPGTSFFSNPRFYPLPHPLSVNRGDLILVHAEHDQQELTMWAGG